jgi:hydroxymethylbilane synthase
VTFDLDIILAAHGAGDSSPANALVQACARQLEVTAVGARVTAAFLRGEPAYTAALVGADRPNRIIVPFFTSDGYYAERLRCEAARASVSGTETNVLAPVGTHQAFIQALAGRAAYAIVQHDFAPAGTIVVVVGHGTTRHAGSGAAAQAVADAVAQRGVTAHAAYLDQYPTIEDVIGRTPPDVNFVIVPFLLGGGDHAANDVPARVNAIAERRGVPPSRVVFLEPMGGLPALSELLEQVVWEARSGRLRLNVGARASLLSVRQIEIFAACVAPLGVDVRFVPTETRGDRDQTTPVDAFGADDPFTGEINEALLAGRIDVAVHSLKDLPFAGDPTIVDAAILSRGSAEEVLVSLTGARLSALPAGARIGTSCVRRASQIRRARPDLVPVPIRGVVPARIDAVDRGDVDAVVLAAAGLERLGLHGRIAERFSTARFVPAAGQGAIVAQCRADSPHLALLQRIDHHATRLAVTAERAFASAVERRDARVAAAHATVENSWITLHARIIDPGSARVLDVSIGGRDPEQVGIAAAELLLVPRAEGVLTGALP